MGRSLFAHKVVQQKLADSESASKEENRSSDFRALRSFQLNRGIVASLIRRCAEAKGESKSLNRHFCWESFWRNSPVESPLLSHHRVLSYL